MDDPRSLIVVGVKGRITVPEREREGGGVDDVILLLGSCKRMGCTWQCLRERELVLLQFSFSVAANAYVLHVDDPRSLIAFEVKGGITVLGSERW